MNILQCRRTCGEVSYPLELMLTQLLLSVFLHRGHKLLFIAALGNTQVHLGTAQLLQQRDDLLRFIRQGLNQNLAWNNLHAAGFHVRFLVHPAPLHVRGERSIFARLLFLALYCIGIELDEEVLYQRGQRGIRFSFFQGL